MPYELEYDLDRHIEPSFTKVAFDSLVDRVLFTNKMQDALHRNISKGGTVKDLTDDLMKITGYERSRCARIAQTERTRAMNASRWKSLIELNKGLKGKKRYRKMWIAKRDERTRASHRSMSGQMRMATEAFVTGEGEKLQYPGDPSGSARETINCRCYMRRVSPNDVAMYGGDFNKW